MTAAYILTVVLLSPADKGLDCIVCNARTYIATSTKLVCHIRTQQRCSTEKDEHVNWVRTNPWTLKNPSAERRDMPRRSYTVIPWLALQNPCRISLEFIGFCKVSCDMYHECHHFHQAALIIGLLYASACTIPKSQCS